MTGRQQRLIDRLDAAVSGVLPHPRYQVADARHAVAPDWADLARGFHWFGARGERWQLSLVLDTAPCMAVWEPVTSALRSVFRGLPGFADVREFPWDTGRANVPEPRRADGTEPHGAGPVGRPQVILVVTDGMGAAWHDGSAHRSLRAWAARHPVACVQLLPRRLWPHSGLRMHRVRLAARGEATPGRELGAVRLESAPTRPPVAAAVSAATAVVPLLSLQGRWFDRWAGLVTGVRSGWTDMAVALIAPTGSQAAGPHQLGDPAARVARYRANAAPAGAALAALLAAAPLPLPTVQVLQRQFAPDTGPRDLAEMIAFGLLVPTPGQPGCFDIDDTIRMILLDAAQRAETQRVLLALDRLADPPDTHFAEVLNAPESTPVPRVDASNARALRIEELALRALAGPFQTRAKALGQALAAWDGEECRERDAVPTGIGPERPIGEMPTAAHRPAGQVFRAGGITEVNSQGGGMSTESSSPDRPTRPLHESPAIWDNVPPRNPNFIGRTELLGDLARRLSSGAAAVLPEAMHGLGGIGKSQLAVEYVYRNQGQYDLVCWIPSERTPSIVNALTQLAARLGISEGMEPGTAVPAVLDALRRGTPYERWLLVFDNAENPEALAPYLPKANCGAVLITSRNPHWDSVAQSLEVDVFLRSESVALLNRRGPELSAEDADRLAETLGDLPLAIEQAAAWRAETGMPAQEYLRLFQEKQSELLFESAPYDYQQSVATAWNVSLDRVEQTSPEAIQLLQVCAFFAPEPIPRNLFSGAHRGSIAPQLDMALADPMRLSRAIREIKKYSLARIDPRNNSIQMHRLVQAVLVARMTPLQQTRMRLGAQLLLASADPRDPESNLTWNRYSELYPHIAAADAVHSEDPWVRDLVLNTAKYLQRWGDHETARTFTQDAYDAAVVRFGSADEKTLALALWLGWILFTMGRFAEASELNAGTLASYESTRQSRAEQANDVRESHLDAIGAVAADLRVKGDFNAALELTRQVYDQAVHAFGEDEIPTMTAAHNLGVCLRLVGRFQDAYQLDKATWNLKQNLLGAEHELTLVTRVGMTIDERELGEYAHARNRQEEIVALYQRLLKDDNPATLHAKRVLAVARRKAGDHAAARELSQEALDVLEARFGPEHPDTIAAALALSVDLRHSGDFTRSRTLADSSRRRYNRIFGPLHPHTLSADVNLAITLRLDGDPEQARDLDQAARDGFDAKLGPRHPLTFVATTNLASDLAALGDPEGALALDTETLTLSSEVLGAAHPSTLAVAANKALDLRQLERIEEAQALHAETLRGMIDRLGAEHPGTTDLAAWIRANLFIDPLPL